MLELYIGNKNYSSWSMRPWLLMRHFGIEFTERRLRLDWNDDSPFKKTLYALAPTGRVPLLVDDGFAVWDTLAITEYLAERFPRHAVWPGDAKARARARSLVAEMHSGFADLRDAFPMNIEAELGEVGARLLAERPAVARDVARVDALWREAVEASGGPFLFGEFSAADAFYAPVCTRVRSYGLPLSPTSRAYQKSVLALPAFRAWEADALAEHDFIVEDEPYRTKA
jgi:glutathione S-transferase